MPEIVRPKEMKAWDRGARKLKNCQPKDVYNIELTSHQQLIELADTLGVKVVFQVGNEFLLRHNGINYFAKQ